MFSHREPVPARVETFEGTGEVFLKHADRATMLPGVDTSKLTPEQRMAELHKLNAEACDCGCNYTLAQCRIYDPACNISKERAAVIVKETPKLPSKDALEIPPRRLRPHHQRLPIPRSHAAENRNWNGNWRKADLLPGSASEPSVCAWRTVI